MKISQALRVDSQSRIAWVGAGGKTTSLFRTARQLPGKVLVSTTAHLAVNQTKLADRHFVVTSPQALQTAEDELVEGINLLSGQEGSKGRLQGLDEELIGRVKDLADHHELPLLIEADGARMLPLKAPADHEPPIPEWVNQVVVVAGLSGIGKKLDETTVFRSEIFSQLTGATHDSQIRLDDVTRLLMHPEGGLKNIPCGDNRVVLFNQLDAAEVTLEEIRAQWNVLSEPYKTVIISSMQDESDEVRLRYEKIAGVILAAGGSDRLGTPKQLLEWRGKPFIVHIVENAISAGLDPVVVVLGAVVEPVIGLLKKYPVRIVINEGWQNGQASSITAGMREITGKSSGAIFLPCDMPQISARYLSRYLTFQQTSDYHILAPRIQGQRANPVMFDERCFHDLAAISGDMGGRQLFDRFPVTMMDVDDPFMALDVDTPEDYRELLAHTGDEL